MRRHRARELSRFDMQELQGHNRNEVSEIQHSGEKNGHPPLVSVLVPFGRELPKIIVRVLLHGEKVKEPNGISGKSMRCDSIP